MELKHFLSDINDLRIHESNNNLSEWGKDKLKEYEFILNELSELKKLRVGDVIGSICYHPLPYRVAKSDTNYECSKCGKFV